MERKSAMDKEPVRKSAVERMNENNTLESKMPFV